MRNQDSLFLHGGREIVVGTSCVAFFKKSKDFKKMFRLARSWFCLIPSQCDFLSAFASIQKKISA